MQRNVERCIYAFMTFMTHVNVKFDIFEPHAFRKYCTWVGSYRNFKNLVDFEGNCASMHLVFKFVLKLYLLMT